MASIRVPTKYDCDVLINGGGPSGSALAFHLAKKGINVIVLESHSFPRDKICGDAVSPVALTELDKLGITRLQGFKKSSTVNSVALYIEEQKINIGLSKKEDHPFKGHVIPRLQLDDWIYQAAEKAGAKYMQSARLISYDIQEEYATATVKQIATAQEIKARVIIGADGSNSTVSRLLNGKSSEAYQLIGMRAYFENVPGPQDQCDIYFTEKNFPGLFWFFPTAAGKANVGSAMISHTLPKNEAHAKKLLIDQIQHHPYLSARIGNGKMVGNIAGWPLKFKDPKSKIISERIMLVGDAAGLINPLSGDGIQYALLSARWASECLEKCVHENDFSVVALSRYKNKLEQEMSYDLALSDLLIQVTRNRTFTSLWMEILRILFDKAKDDKEYANIIGGIFDGTLPSYKALDPDFIIKSLVHGGVHIGLKTMEGIMKGPAHWIQEGGNAGQLTKQIVSTLLSNPADQIKWLKDIAIKGVGVGGHVIKDVRKGK